MVWVFEWGPECEEILSKTFLWENNTTFDVLNLIIGKNCEEILVSHVMPGQLGYLENFVPFPLIRKRLLHNTYGIRMLLCKRIFFFLK